MGKELSRRDDNDRPRRNHELILRGGSHLVRSGGSHLAKRGANSAPDASTNWVPTALRGFGALVLLLGLLGEFFSWLTSADFPFLGFLIASLVLLWLSRGPTGRAKNAPVEFAHPAYRNHADHESTHGERSNYERSSYSGFENDLRIHISTWQDAELSARNFLEVMGHPGARLTNYGADGGIDVISYRAIAQVKHLGKPVGRPSIEQLKGATMRREHAGKSAIFFSTSGYTAQAVQAARELDVQLYEIGNQDQWKPVY